MKTSERVTFWGGVFLLITLVSLIPWAVLSLFAWYIKRIPDKKMPLAAYLSGNQKTFYDWLSKFLSEWVKQSIQLTGFIIAVVLVIAGLLWFTVNVRGTVLPFDLSPLANISVFLVFVYLTTVATSVYGFLQTKYLQWDVLFWQAVPAAKLLVGNDEYDALLKNDQRKVLRNVVDSTIGINKATIVVSGGELKIMNPPAGELAKFGGTGVLVVQEAHAVVLEQSGKISRVVGRGITFLEMFERVSMVIPLMTRAEKPKIEHILTQDQVIIPSIKLWVYHRLQQGNQLHANGAYPFDEALIRENVWSPGGHDWRGLVASVAETAVRDVVARHTLEDLLLASDEQRRKLREEIRHGIQAVTGRVASVDIVVVEIGEIELPKDVSDKMWAKWHAVIDRQIQVTESEKQRDVMVRKAEADNKLRKSEEEIKVEMVRRLTDPILQLANQDGQDRAVIQKYIEMMENLAKEIIHDDVALMRYVEALEKTSQSSAQKTVIWADPKIVLDTSTGT